MCKGSEYENKGTQEPKLPLIKNGSPRIKNGSHFGSRTFASMILSNKIKK